MIPTSTAPVGPPPPYDAECRAALAGMPEVPPLTLETIPAIRVAAEQFVPRPTNDELARGGAFTVEERTIAGPEEPRT